MRHIVKSLGVTLFFASNVGCGNLTKIETPADDSKVENGTPESSNQKIEFGAIELLSDYEYEKKHSVQLPTPAKSLSLVATKPRYCDVQSSSKYFTQLAVENIKEKFCNGELVKTGIRYKMLEQGRVSYLLARLHEDKRLIVTRCTEGGTKLVTVTDTTEKAAEKSSVGQYYYGTNGKSRVSEPSLQVISKTAGIERYSYMYHSEYDQTTSEGSQKAYTIGHVELSFPKEGSSTIFEQLISGNPTKVDRERKGYKFNGRSGAYMLINEVEKEGKFQQTATPTSEQFAMKDGAIDPEMKLSESEFNAPIETNLRVKPVDQEWACDGFDHVVDLRTCAADGEAPTSNAGSDPCN